MNLTLSNISELLRNSSGFASVDNAQLVVQVLNYIDLTVRVLATLAYLSYFSIVGLRKELRKANLFYVHHAIFVNFVYVLIYLSFFNSTAPSLSSAYLNDIFCRLVEILFGVLKFLRSYSVLLIACYRCCAVYSIVFFKKINSSALTLFVPLLVTWSVSVSLALVSKFSFRTTYSASLCTDGYSLNMSDLVGYLIETSILSILVPFSLTQIIYYFITNKLKKNIDGMTSDTTTKQHRRDLRFSKQLVAINTCYLISFTIAFVQTFRYIIPGFNTNYYYLRQGLRILNLTSISFLPLISIYFNPMITIRNMKVSIISRSTIKFDV